MNLLKKIKKNKIEGNKFNRAEVIFSSNAFKNNRLCIILEIDYKSVIVNSVLLSIPYLDVIERIDLNNNTILFFISGNSKQYCDLLKYFIFYLKRENDLYINFIIKSIYENCSLDNYYRDLINKNILNKSSFIKLNNKEYKEIFCDIENINMDYYKDILGDSVYDICQVTEENKSYSMRYVVKEHIKELEEYLEKINIDAKNIWYDDMELIEEDIDEIL